MADTTDDNIPSAEQRFSLRVEKKGHTAHGSIPKSSDPSEAYWEFSFFTAEKVSQGATGSLIDELTKAISLNGEKLTSEDIIASLKDKEKRAQLKEIYKKNIEEKRKAIKGDKSLPNVRSLAMYHGPVNHQTSGSRLFWLPCTTPCSLRPWRPPSLVSNDLLELLERYSLLHASSLPSHSPVTHYFGQLLTGDINLKDLDIRTEFLSFYKEHLRYGKEEKLFLFVVPHHGSQNSWDQELLDHVLASTHFLIPAGLPNHHGHPDDLVVSSILRSRYPLIWAHQYQRCTTLGDIQY